MNGNADSGVAADATGSRVKATGPQKNRGVAALTSDLGELAELQMQLLAADARQGIRRAVFPILVAFASAAMVIAAGPVLLLGLSAIIQERWDLSVGGARLMVGAVGLALSLLSLKMAAGRLRTAADPLGRSLRELSANVSSLRSAFAAHAKSPPER